MHGRANYGDTFGICVAGYPEAHPDVIVDDPEKMKENYWKDVHYLKEKVCAARSELHAGGDGLQAATPQELLVLRSCALPQSACSVAT